MNFHVRIPDGLADLPVAGSTLERAWTWRLARAGHQRTDAATAEAWLDGRFLALSDDDLDQIAIGGRALEVDSLIVGDHLRPAGATPSALPPEARHPLTSALGLSTAEALLRRWFTLDLMELGVHIVDPSRVLIDLSATVAPTVRIWPDVVIRGACILHGGVEIRPGCWIEATEIGEGSVILPHCVCTSARVGPATSVGPMAHLRPGTTLAGENKVGNFVEIKKATLHRGAKASHLSYLGDAEVGEGANIGAGTITCNYDGHRKHRTTIGARAFIGSNSALVAPVQIGDGAIVGAGTVLTRDAPPDSLAVERGELRIHEGMGRKLNERNARRAAAQKTREEPGG